MVVWTKPEFAICRSKSKFSKEGKNSNLLSDIFTTIYYPDSERKMIYRSREAYRMNFPNRLRVSTQKIIRLWLMLLFSGATASSPNFQGSFLPNRLRMPESPLKESRVRGAATAFFYPPPGSASRHHHRFFTWTSSGFIICQKLSKQGMGRPLFYN